jgi:hypothetical protein
MRAIRSVDFWRAAVDVWTSSCMFVARSANRCKLQHWSLACCRQKRYDQRRIRTGLRARIRSNGSVPAFPWGVPERQGCGHSSGGVDQRMGKAQPASQLTSGSDMGQYHCVEYFSTMASPRKSVPDPLGNEGRDRNRHGRNRCWTDSEALPPHRPQTSGTAVEGSNVRGNRQAARSHGNDRSAPASPRTARGAQECRGMFSARLDVFRARTPFVNRAR